MLQGQIPVVLRTYYHPPGGRLKAKKNRLLFKFISAFDAGVCGTEVEKAQIVREGYDQPDRLKVIPPGVRFFDISDEEKQAFRKQRGLDGRIVISHVGRLSEFKGTGRLIRALGELRKEAPQPLTLLLIGKCADREWLDSQIGQHAEPSEVVETGEIIDERELHLAVGSSDLFALPSDYESFGFVFLEAMASSVPVIAPATGGVPGLVEEGEQGYMVKEPDDEKELLAALKALVGDRELRHRMGQSGAWKARKVFSWSVTTQCYVDLLDSIKQAGSSDPPRAR